MYFDVEIETELDGLDKKLFEAMIAEFAEPLASSVTHYWGTSAFFSLEAKSIEDAFVQCLAVVRRTGARITGAELSNSDKESHDYTCNAYRTSGLGEIDV